MYNISLPRELLKELYELREKHGKGPIARQVREAVKAYIVREKRKIATAEKSKTKEKGS